MLSILTVFPISAAEQVQFQLNIEEVLTVSLTLPDEWATDKNDNGIGDFLRNKIELSVVSNNAAGFTATMYSKTTTDLVNQSKATSTIPTLAATTQASNFPANYWGYSLNDSEAGSSTANYNAMSTTAVSVVEKTAPAAVDQPIYFGAKADLTKDSGTYKNEVVFSVVSGVVAEAPVEDPVEDAPVADSGTNSTPGASSGPSSIALDEEEDLKLESNSEANDVTNTYEDPKGVTTTTNVNSGTPIATGLAVTAGVAAVSGIVFFIVAKRKEEEEENPQW